MISGSMLEGHQALIVIYNLRKFVKKGKGFKPGSVTVEREKTLWIELKEERLSRLKGGPN
jgi:predicted ribosome quality control (RQC) complex YloA/Tae2 family protein